MRRSAPPRRWLRVLGIASALLCATTARAQTEGGLYVAGAGSTFQAAAQQGLANNPGGRRFFVLALPPETVALTTRASAAQRTLRERVQAGNGVLFVCQRDVDDGRVARNQLAPGVVVVRGWPPGQAGELSDGRRALAGEDPALLPASNEALRRLRSSCS